MKGRLILIVGLICAAAAVIIPWVLHSRQVGYWMQVHTGTINESGPYYGFWSGFGSDLEEFGILGAIGAGIYQLIKKYNCHEPGCWRIGQHPAAGGQFLLCYRHHPDYQGRKPTHELIERLHREHLERQAAMQSKLHEAHQHRTAEPATANDVHRPQPSAQRLGRCRSAASSPGRPVWLASAQVSGGVVGLTGTACWAAFSPPKPKPGRVMPCSACLRDRQPGPGHSRISAVI